MSGKQDGGPKRINSGQSPTKRRKSSSNGDEIGENEVNLSLPTQSATERRLLREQYRKLIDEAKGESNNGDLVDSQSEKLQQKLEDANELFQKVKNPREAALDSELLYLCAALGKQKVQALNMDFVQFQPLDYAEKIRDLLFKLGEGCHTNEEDVAMIPSKGWERFGKSVAPLFKRSPTLKYMLGTFNMESIPKPTKVPARRNKKDAENVKITSPDNVNECKTESTTEEVERVLSVLHHIYNKNEKQPLCFFEFVINPHSYGLTIENIFHVSFLVKDGFAEIFHDADKLPCIVPVLERSSEDDQRKQKRNQVVISLTMDEWKEIVQVFKIDEPVIPPKASKSSQKRKK